RRFRQRDDVLALVLGARRRQRDGSVGTEFAPAQVGDFVAACASEDQELDDGAVLAIRWARSRRTIRQRQPDGAPLVIRKHALARLLLRFVGEGDRVVVDIALACSPCEEAGQRRPYPVARRRTTVAFEFAQHTGDGPPSDALDW